MGNIKKFAVQVYFAEAAKKQKTFEGVERSKIKEVRLAFKQFRRFATDSEVKGFLQAQLDQLADYPEQTMQANFWRILVDYFDIADEESREQAIVSLLKLN